MSIIVLDSILVTLGALNTGDMIQPHSEGDHEGKSMREADVKYSIASFLIWSARLTTICRPLRTRPRARSIIFNSGLDRPQTTATAGSIPLFLWNAREVIYVYISNRHGHYWYLPTVQLHANPNRTLCLCHNGNTMYQYRYSVCGLCSL